MTRAFGVVLVVGALLVPPGGVEAQDDLDDRVGEAIERGLEYLRRQQSRAGHWDYRLAHDHRLGMTALCGLALVENGVPRDDETVRRAEAVVRELAMTSDQSYDLSLAILFLSRIRGTGQGDEDPLIGRITRRLDAGNLDGAWSYRVPIDESYERAESTGSRPAGGRPRFAGGAIDHSNTQFALLGIWAGGRQGFDSDGTLAALDQHFRSSVNRDGGVGVPAGDRQHPADDLRGPDGALHRRGPAVAGGTALVSGEGRRPGRGSGLLGGASEGDGRREADRQEYRHLLPLVVGAGVRGARAPGTGRARLVQGRGGVDPRPAAQDGGVAVGELGGVAGDVPGPALPPQVEPGVRTRPGAASPWAGVGAGG